jgi:DnaJ-class molecular chaperone
VADPDCGLCGGDGVIYDWSKRGDPCPECTGGHFRTSSNIKMQVSRGGCVLVLVVLVLTTTVLTLSTTWLRG